MKKILYLVLFLFLAQITAVHAEQPIPSFKFRLYHMANFREHNQGGGHNPLKSAGTKGKRDLNVVATSTSSTPTGQAVIYIYSSDFKTIIGPLTISEGETISVPVDDREWGVFVVSDDHLYIDVFSSGSSAP